MYDSDNNAGIRKWANALGAYETPAIVTSMLFMALYLLSTQHHTETASEYLVTHTLSDFQIATWLYSLYLTYKVRKIPHMSAVKKFRWFSSAKALDTQMDQAQDLERMQIETLLYRSISNIACAICLIVSYLLLIR